MNALTGRSVMLLLIVNIDIKQRSVITKQNSLYKCTGRKKH